MDTPESADLQNMIVLLYDNQGQPPTQAFCQAYKQQYNIQIPLYFDAQHQMKVYGEHETNLILNESGRIVARIIGDSNQVFSAIEAELAVGEGECSTAFACSAEESCLPSPAGDAKLCAELCKTTDADPCPNGGVCYSYTPGGDNGACFPANMIP